MHWSLIQRLRQGSIAAANPAGSRLNLKNKYVPVHTSMYSFTDSCTAVYLHVPPYTFPCTIMYHLVPTCTTVYHDSTGQYILEHPCTYRPRNFLCQYILVRTILRFLVLPCRQKRTYQDVPVQTALYRHIPGVQDSRRTTEPETHWTALTFQVPGQGLGGRLGWNLGLGHSKSLPLRVLLPVHAIHSLIWNPDHLA
jgi:hypothetical protein